MTTIQESARQTSAVDASKPDAVIRDGDFGGLSAGIAGDPWKTRGADVGGLENLRLVRPLRSPRTSGTLAQSPRAGKGTDQSL